MLLNKLSTVPLSNLAFFSKGLFAKTFSTFIFGPSADDRVLSVKNVFLECSQKSISWLLSLLLEIGLLIREHEQQKVKIYEGLILMLARAPANFELATKRGARPITFLLFTYKLIVNRITPRTMPNQEWSTIFISHWHERYLALVLLPPDLIWIERKISSSSH